MLLGLSRLIMIECPECKRGRSLKKNELNNIFNPTSFYKCTCGNSQLYIEGIIKSLVSENTSVEYCFISDILEYGNCEVIIGESLQVELTRKIPVINKIFLTNIGGIADISSVIQDKKSFKIISSEVYGSDQESKYKKIGQKHKVSWILYGRNEDLNIPVWRSLLVQSKEELINNKYNLALLTSEMAFESFIDLLLSQIFYAKGISEKAAYCILNSINIYDKVHKLLFYLDGIKFKEETIVNKNWQKLVERRNKVAHGEVIDISKDEARQAFETVIRGILFIVSKTSVAIMFN